MFKKFAIVLLLMQLSFGFAQKTKSNFSVALNESYYLTKNNPQYSIIKHQQIFDEAKKQSDQFAMMQAQLQIVISYHCLDNNFKVVENVLALEDLAQKNKNFFYLCSAMQYKAYAISYVESFAESRKMLKDIFKKSENISNRDDRRLMQANLYQTKALVFFQDSIMPIDSAFVNIKESIRLFKKFPPEKRYNYVGESYRILGECFTLKKQNDSAVFFVNRALEIAKSKKNTFEEILAECAFANHFYTNFEDEKAVLHYQKAADLSEMYGNEILLNHIYFLLSETYGEMGNHKKANEILNLKTALAEKLIPIQAKSREETIKLVAKQKEDDQANDFGEIRMMVYVIFVATVLLVIVILMLLKRYNQTADVTEQQSLVLSDQKQQLDNLIKVKEKDLKKLHSLAKKDSPLFLGRGKELYPEFFVMLNQVQPNLTLTEQKFSFYLKLGFTTQQIAEFNQVSVKAIQSRKSRLRKRLSLNASEDLYLYMQNLDANLL